MEKSNSERFDEKGNERILRTLPNGTTAMMSQQEYEAELDASKEK